MVELYTEPLAASWQRSSPPDGYATVLAREPQLKEGPVGGGASSPFQGAWREASLPQYPTALGGRGALAEPPPLGSVETALGVRSSHRPLRPARRTGSRTLSPTQLG